MWHCHGFTYSVLSVSENQDINLSLLNCINMKKESEHGRISKMPPINKFSFSPGIAYMLY